MQNSSVIDTVDKVKRIVVKFGGSNLRTKGGFQKLLKAVQYYDRPLIIVVSACFGVTDMLVKTISTASYDKESIQSIKRSLQKIHFEIIDFHISDTFKKNSVKRKIKTLLNELGKLIQGINCIKEVPDFLEDKILSFGEKLSSLVLTSVLENKIKKVKEYLPENIGLTTIGEFHNASIDLIVSGKNLKKHLLKDHTCVIPGFYGVSHQQQITLLGRGGSDYSATAIARCIDADAVDLWKDVPGFMTADPKYINNPDRVSFLTYDEAAELSYFGAKILHPRTFEPLYKKDIPIRIFNINNFSKSLSPSTIIRSGKETKNKIIKSVTFSEDFGILKLLGPGVGITPGILAKVSSVLHKESINIKSVITSQTSINILISSSDLIRCREIMTSLKLEKIENIKIVGNISVIAIVGEGLTKSAGIASRLFTAVSIQNINIHMISAGASDVAIYFLVDKKENSKALKAIHNEFFKKTWRESNEK